MIQYVDKNRDHDAMNNNQTNMTNLIEELPFVRDLNNEPQQRGKVIHTQVIKEDNPFVDGLDDTPSILSNPQQEKKPDIQDMYMQTINNDQTYNGRKKCVDKYNTEENSQDELLMEVVSHENDFDQSKSDENKTNIDSYNPHFVSSNKIDNKRNVQILGATKISESQGRPYIAYKIKYGDSVVSRRYSEFESLRKILVKLFPMTLIPPIPEKQSLSSYGRSITGKKSNYLLPSETTSSMDLSFSIINGSINTSDEKLIRHRIRMLKSFLNRLLKMEEICKTSIISDFLNPNNVNWNDVITSSATISSLPKSVLQCNPLDPTNTTRAHAFLPVPSSSAQMLINKEPPKFKDNDEEILLLEHDFKKYEMLLNNGFYKYNRKITKTMHDMKQDVKELSKIFAQFSIETKFSDLAQMLSNLSTVYEESNALLETIVGKMYYNINEPLNESIHMAGSARELIRYRKLKLLQKDMLHRALAYKKGQLNKLKDHGFEVRNMSENINPSIHTGAIANIQHPETIKNSGSSFMNKINKLANIVKETVVYQDHDPISTVRLLENEILQLKESLEVSERDLKVITHTIKAIQLPEFSRNKDKEVLDILRNYTKYIKKFAQNNLKLWQQIRTPKEQL